MRFTPDALQQTSWKALLRSRIVIIASSSTLLVLIFFFLGSTLKSRTHTPDWAPFGDMSQTSSDAVRISAATPETRHLRIEAVPGYFAPSDPKTDPTTYDYGKTGGGISVLGLQNRQYDVQDMPRGLRYQWQRFEVWLNQTNVDAPAGTVYKVFFIGRHGEGEHNVAEAKYGTPMWDEYYSRLPNFTDPHLTAKGYEQAQNVGEFFGNAIKNHKLAMPQSYYVSPLARCLSTAMLSFSCLELPKWRRFHAVVKEQLREKLGVHTCDKRSSKTWIFNHFNAFDIESGFTEEDELWDPDVRETDEQQIERAKVLLTDIFDHDPSSIISLTTHSGMLNAILAAVGHRPFPLPTGSIMAVLMKGERSGLDLAWGPTPGT